MIKRSALGVVVLVFGSGLALGCSAGDGGARGADGGAGAATSTGGTTASGGGKSTGASGATNSGGMNASGGTAQAGAATGGQSAGDNGIREVDCEGSGTFAWPGGAVSALSLTYDDALPTQIATVEPLLDQYGFKATFFINSGRFAPGAFLYQDQAVWQALFAKGHEFASHTVNHPCDAEWVEPQYNLKTYDLPKISQELDDSVAFLKLLGVPGGTFTFAYPCGQFFVGGAMTSYKPEVESRFLAARGTNWGPADPATLDLMEIPGFAVAQESEAVMAGWLDQTAYDGKWLIYTIHGVGGDNNLISAASHEELLAKVEASKTKLWIDTFGTIASYVKRCR